MLMTWIILVSMLCVILLAAQIFTNAIEHVGDHLKLSTGVTGSIFSAVATALPEASVPILALTVGTQDKSVNHDIGIGAILGAPLMLSTLSLWVLALFLLKKRGFFGYLHPEQAGYKRDLYCSLYAFILSLLAMFIPQTLFSLKMSVGFLLIAIYIFYLYLTFKASKHLVSSGHGVLVEEKLYLAHLRFKDSLSTALIQVVLGIGILLLGVKGFIYSIDYLARYYEISVLLLSLLIIPVATELPEKVNSIIWTRKGKDTLGVGNITGAMVFQGTLLPALGIFFTPWQPVRPALISVVITIVATMILILSLRKNGMPLMVLHINGLLYLLYLYLSL